MKSLHLLMNNACGLRNNKILIFHIWHYISLQYCHPVCVCAHISMESSSKFKPYVLICNIWETTHLFSREAVYISSYPTDFLMYIHIRHSSWSCHWHELWIFTSESEVISSQPHTWIPWWSCVKLSVKPIILQ